jgi:hypothetical protein
MEVARSTTKQKAEEHCGNAIWNTHVVLDVIETFGGRRGAPFAVTG